MTQIVPLDRYNWERCLNIKLLPEQDSFVPNILYSLAQARFEQLVPYGILYRGEMVGMVMYGEFGGVCWISRIMIDADFQGRGIGTRAVDMLLRILKRKFSCKEIRTSYSPQNDAAANFFSNLGFQPMETRLDDEVVAVFVEQKNR